MATYLELRAKYPDRIPLMIERSDIPLNKKKYLIPYEMYVSEFIRYIYRHTDSSKSVIIFIEGHLPRAHAQFNEYLNDKILKVSLLYNTTFG